MTGCAKKHSMIVVAQAGLAVWCAVVGVLLARSLLNLQALDPGFRVDELVFVDLQVPYAFGQLPEDFPDRLEAVADRLEARPSVESVTSVLVEPLDDESERNLEPARPATERSASP